MMSNENNNGVIDFDSSTFVSGSVDNASSTNTVNQDSTSNSSASNINVDDIFGTWDNSSSSTQSDVKPVSNDYNNSDAFFNNGNTNGEGSNVTPPNVFDIFGNGASEGQSDDTITSSDGSVELAMDNSELTKLAMNAFAGLTSNGVSLGSPEQETDSSSNATIQTEEVAETSEQAAFVSSTPETSAVSSKTVNVPVQSVPEQTVPVQTATSLESPDYMAAFANPFANSKGNQATVSQPQMETTPASTEPNGLESQNPNPVATDVQTNFDGANVAIQAVSTDVPNLTNPSFENVDVANHTNVVGDFNGFSGTDNNLENNVLGTATSDINSITINPNVVPENNDVTNDFVNQNPSDAVATFENQPNPALNTVPPVAPGDDNQVMPNIPNGFNNQFVTPSPEIVSIPNTFNAETPVAPVSGEGSIENQTPVNVNANVEPVVNNFESATSQGFNNDNVVNPDMGTFNTQDTIAPQVQVPNDSNVQSNVNVAPQNVVPDVQIPTDFNVATPETQAPTNVSNSGVPSFDNGNIVNPDMGTFNTQDTVAPQVEVPNDGNVQSNVNVAPQNVVSDVQIPTDFNVTAPETQAPINASSPEATSFENGNIVNPDMGTFNAQSNVTPQVEMSNGVDMQPATNTLQQPVNLENPTSPDFNANNFNNQVSTDFNASFNQVIDNQVGVNNALNNQPVNNDSNVGIVPDNSNVTNAASNNTNVISPESATNLQQALSTPANNVTLDNSISVGSIPNGQVATPVVTDNNQESTQVPAKKQGKVSLPVVMLIIIIVFSVGVIILRRNELMDFFQTLMKK